MAVALVSALMLAMLLVLLLRLSQRLTLRMKVLAGVTLSRGAARSCPHLGSAADPFSHADAPADDHRCYLWMQRDRIDLAHQKGFCLTSAHHRCPWLVVRRPDAPLPLRVRLRAAGTGLPRRALAMAATVAQRARALAGGVARFGAVSGRRMVALARAMVVVPLTTVRRLAVVLGAAASTMAAAPARAVRMLNAPRQALQKSLAGGASKAGHAPRLAGQGGGHLVRVLWRTVAIAAHRLAVLVAAAGTLALRAASFLARRATSWWQAWQNRPQPVMTAPAAAATPVASAVAPAAVALVAQVALPTMAVAQAPAAAGERTSSAWHERLLRQVEDTVAEGLATLDRGQEALAYQLFVKATEQDALSSAFKSDAPRQAQCFAVLTRAWFWRAKTSEALPDLIFALEQALRFDPSNLQIQAHLDWARQRQQREQVVSAGPNVEATPVPHTAFSPGLHAPARTSVWALAFGESMRLLGGLAALGLAGLWLLTGALPAFARYLTELPAGQQAALRQLLLTLDLSGLPGGGHLDLPLLRYDISLALPFVLGFLFVFTARGVVDGDGWARTGALALAGVAGWLCLASVTNATAAQLALALCVSLIVAAAAGRFTSEYLLPGQPGLGLHT